MNLSLSPKVVIKSLSLFLDQKYVKSELDEEVIDVLEVLEELEEGK